MALTIEFSRRSTNQLQKILTFYDERNGSQAVEGLSEEMKDELKECYHGEIDNLTINK